MMASQKPKKQVQKDQVIEIGKVISSLQDKKYVQLSRQRDLKRQLEASYMEVSKIDIKIITKREEMMQLIASRSVPEVAEQIEEALVVEDDER